MPGETPRPTEEAPAEASPQQEPVSGLPESAPAPEVPAEDPAEKQALMEEANKELQEAYVEQAPVSEPAQELAPKAPASSESAGPASQEQQQVTEPAAEPVVEQQPEPTGTMSEAEKIAFERLDRVGKDNLSPEELEEADKIWDEGGLDRADKLNEIASRIEQRIATGQTQTAEKPEGTSAGKSVPESTPEAQAGSKEEQSQPEKAEPELQPSDKKEQPRPEANQPKSEKPEQKIEDQEKGGEKKGEGARPETSKARETAENQVSLNRLQKQIDKLRAEIENIKTERLRTEVEQLRKEKETLQTESLARELEQLLSERERLAEKVTGKSITEVITEAEKKVGEILGYSTREDYVRALAPVAENSVRATKERIFAEQEFAKLSKSQQKKYGGNPKFFQDQMIERGKKMGLSPDEFYGLLNAGYSPQSIKNKGFFTLRLPFRNFFRSEKRIVLPDGKKAWMRTKDFMAMAKMEGERYKDKIANEARRQLGEKWSDEVKRQTEESLEKTANDLDGAIERTRVAYREARINMLSEYLGGLGKKQLTVAQLRARERMFGQKPGRGRNVENLFDAMANHSGKFKFNGEAGQNSKILRSALGDYGYSDFSPAAARGIFGGSAYERAKKEKGGLLRLFLDALKKITAGFKTK